jgi:hypothetical protein
MCLDHSYETASGLTPGRDEPEQSERWRREAGEYVGEHLGRLPVVVAARVGRTWSLYPLSPVDKARFASDYYRRIRARSHSTTTQTFARHSSTERCAAFARSAKS